MSITERFAECRVTGFKQEPDADQPPQEFICLIPNVVNINGMNSKAFGEELRGVLSRQTEETHCVIDLRKVENLQSSGVDEIVFSAKAYPTIRLLLVFGSESASETWELRGLNMADLWGYAQIVEKNDN